MTDTSELTALRQLVRALESRAERLGGAIPELIRVSTDRLRGEIALLEGHRGHAPLTHMTVNGPKLEVSDLPSAHAGEGVSRADG